MPTDSNDKPSSGPPPGSSPSAKPRTTKQREVILEAFEDAARPLNPAEAHELAQRTLPKIGIATIYRTIRLFEDEGLLHKVELPGEMPRYELHTAAEHHHHHFRCDDCGKVYDIEGCLKGFDQMLPKGFKLRAHDITLYGGCAECEG